MYMSVKFILYKMLKSSVSLLSLCLDVLRIDENGVLMAPNSILLLSVSLFRSVNTCFIYLGSPMLGA